MPAKYLYEYAVIRLLPKVEREEFINVGVVLFSKSAGFLDAKFHLDQKRLACFASELAWEDVEKNLEAFAAISRGSVAGGVVAQWDRADRFRWLTAVRSSCIQTSRPHNGFSDDLRATLERLFAELVL